VKVFVIYSESETYKKKERDTFIGFVSVELHQKIIEIVMRCTWFLGLRTIELKMKVYST
jgi:hypothetical protein